MATINIKVSEKAVKALSKAINSILSSKSEEATKQCALATLEAGSKIENITITNCVFNSKAK